MQSITLLLCLSFFSSKVPTAAIVVMCENGGKTLPARVAEQGGFYLLWPWLWPFYQKIFWLVGEKATKKRFLDTLKKATLYYKAVDVYLFLHGRSYGHSFADGELTPSELVREMKKAKGDRIRMVYTTACYSYPHFFNAWRKIGAKAVRGMKGVNRPLDFPRFLLGWLFGETYEEANRAGFQWNRKAHKIVNLIRPYLVIWIHKALKKHRELPLRERQKKDIRDFLLYFHNWFHEPWDIRESYPHIVGKKVRLYDIP